MDWQDSRWRKFVESDPLSFRAMCHEAVKPERRPLPPEVIDSLRVSREAEGLFASRSSSDLPGAEEMAQDARWRTLVVEALERYDRHKAMHASAYQHFQKWLTTRGHSGETPLATAARAGLAAGSASLGIAVTFVLANAAGLSVPVSFELAQPDKPVALTISSSFDKPVPLTVDAALSARELPLKVITEPTTVRLEAEVLQRGDIAALADVARAGAAELKRATDTVREGLLRQEQELGGMRRGLDLFQPVFASSLERIERSIQGGINRNDLQELGRAIAGSTVEASRQTALLAAGRRVASVSVPEDSTREISFEWMGLGSAHRGCQARFSVGTVGRQTVLNSVAGSCKSSDSEVSFARAEPVQVRRGDQVTLGAVPFAVFVETVSKPLLGKGHVTLQVVTTRTW